ncbi:CaiB/BaiF CoA-transferase family protein [Ferrovibrio sp.]|uniref:CaiB/BaiF CoA transferase family protein n=1 Tax=Ferrovibrio sp. TaxID=1917215 RepID=UPI000CAB5781|nr:CaiB/BaiF CoA-transferase family protein [Ferrovibrio sp.]PJI40916.1 MAG: carnitine dehydratase [Ferrovibrio sp.]
MSGPLSGLKIIEMPSIGPVPFCGMLLADLGADVLRIDRTGDVDLGLPIKPEYELLGRGKRSLALNLKDAKAIALVLDLIARADIVIEGFRPGVMERLGLGPDAAHQRNPQLIYGRMTGWGQNGPLAMAAGHDINYIALTGALHAIGHRGGKPVPPLNLVGDFGGGSLYLAMGVLAALFERQKSGSGQVVDAAMVDGAASLMTMFYGMKGIGLWSDVRGDNILDGAAPWYDTYECRDGGFVAVGSVEGKFYAELVQKLGLDVTVLPKQYDGKSWPSLRDAIATAFKSKTRTEWCDIMEGSNVCFAPVLGLEEAPQHSHMKARETFVSPDGITQPAPAPRFSRTPGAIRRSPPSRGEGGEQALIDWGYKPADGN